jgi:hypothetical protein
MEIRRRRVASGIRAIALLAVSITITAAIAAAMLIDTLTVPALTAAGSQGCPRAVYPVLDSLKFVEGRCW